MFFVNQKVPEVATPQAHKSSLINKAKRKWSLTCYNKLGYKTSTSAGDLLKTIIVVRVCLGRVKSLSRKATVLVSLVIK
jgi:hypothetical protein